MWSICIVLLILLNGIRSSPKNISIFVNLTNSVDYLKPVPDRYWQSTGFTPASDILNPNGTENTWWMGRIPRNGIHYVRIHFLYSLLTVIGQKNETSLIYNWTKLDKTIQILYENNRYPIFELMGNPSLYFTNLSNITQIYIWKDLVSQTAQRYINKYTTKVVYQWLFETWNEPPHSKWTPGFNWTETSWTMYYDACSEGLLNIDKNLLLGAPSGAHDNYLNVALTHMVNGTNFFNKSQIGNRINFISVHNKGNQDEETVIHKDLNTEKQIVGEYKSLLDRTMLFNDEGDPKEGWNKLFDWRATTSYAAFIVQGINLHLNKMKTSYDNDMDNRMIFGLISNDNCFMGNSSLPSWFQRTLNVRFIDQMNQNKFEFVSKPSLHVMSLLSLHGNKVLNSSRISYVSVNKLETESIVFYNESNLLYEILLVVYGNDTNKNDDNTQQLVYMNISFTLDNDLIFYNPIISVWNLDYKYGNPYSLWLEFNSPNTPTMDQISMMRSASYPKLNIYNNITLNNDIISAPKYIELNSPGLTFIHLIMTKQKIWNVNPTKIQNVQIFVKDNKYSFLNESENIYAYYISWDSVKSHIIKTFVVYYSKSNKINNTESLIRISNDDFINDGFVWIVENITNGYIYVNAMDYYNLNSTLSDPLSISDN